MSQSAKCSIILCLSPCISTQLWGKHASQTDGFFSSANINHQSYPVKCSNSNGLREPKPQVCWRGIRHDSWLKTEQKFLYRETSCSRHASTTPIFHSFRLNYNFPFNLRKDSRRWFNYDPKKWPLNSTEILLQCTRASRKYTRNCIPYHWLVRILSIKSLGLGQNLFYWRHFSLQSLQASRCVCWDIAHLLNERKDQHKDQ